MMNQTGRRKGLVSWSSGKDSAWALHLLRQAQDVHVVGLITTMNKAFDRVAMHSVRRQLLERQIEAAGLEPWIVEIPHPCSNEEYAAAMNRFLEKAVKAGIDLIAFGDLFLQDIREYRERQMAGSGIELLFPLWMQDTRELAATMLVSGVRARVTCVDPRVLSSTFAGREWDDSFLADLPQGVDPCGENGEFHTFVYDGPMFSRAVPVRTGEVVAREGFVFADLLPA